ncbi:hypothetical protein AVMA1855_09560 [Acidovorax sp. SUPP1855]|uniref:hypothetical protein n=1 Tax=Acidovorax sp. SUPP1855 TaxID=431774 RepID=UPI0023DE31B9|nr:hypothetical protein [Acidovorax sp. SUPP1855]GKS84386.1 hypothetical protein AVMA1855_09560 [Acidovorax sp. SUPP1855]
MTLPDFRSRWHIGRSSACLTSGALAHAIDVLSGVSLRMGSPCRRACSASASAPRFARHRLLHCAVHSPVQTACPERAMPAAWLVFAGWPAALCAAQPGHRIPVPSGRGKMQGKIEGCGTKVRTKPVCTWGWRGTRSIAAPCRELAQSLVGLDETTCAPRHGPMACAGTT